VPRTPDTYTLRYNYVTPTSYLELLATLLKLLADKRTEVTAAKRRLESGLGKLTSTATQVEDMQRELQELQPVLAATAQDVESMMLVIARDKAEAATTKQVVEQQEREANEQAAIAKSIAGACAVDSRASCSTHARALACCAPAFRVQVSCDRVLLSLAADEAQRELDAALPALDAALASLKNLSRNDVVEVRSLQNPPQGVKLVMEAACIMFDEKPKLKDDPTKMGELWRAARCAALAACRPRRLRGRCHLMAAQACGRSANTSRWPVCRQEGARLLGVQQAAAQRRDQVPGQPAELQQGQHP
jgi:dynein heavy chain